MCSSCKLITWYPSGAVRGSFIFDLVQTELFWQSSYGTMKTVPALWRSNVFYIILLHPVTCIKSYPRSTSKATTKRFNLFLSFKKILSICRFVVIEGYTYWKLTSISPSHNSFAFELISFFIFIKTCWTLYFGIVLLFIKHVFHHWEQSLTEIYLFVCFFKQTMD